MDERSSPARVAGKLFRIVEIGGAKYTLSEPQRMNMFADQEALILSRRLDPLGFATRAVLRMPANRHAAIWEGCAAAASRGMATQEEWDAFEESLWKPAFMFWKCLDPAHKEQLADEEGIKTLNDGVAWALEVLHQARNRGEFMRLMEEISLVSQDRDIKNSSGPREASGTPKTDAPSSVDGPQSTPTSPNDSAGPNER